jgi:hypothetical protein
MNLSATGPSGYTYGPVSVSIENGVFDYRLTELDPGLYVITLTGYGMTVVREATVLEIPDFEGYVEFGTMLEPLVRRVTNDNQLTDRIFETQIADRTFETQIADRTFETQIANRTFETQITNRTFETQIANRTFETQIANRTFETKLDARRFETQLDNREFETQLDNRVFETQIADREFETQLANRTFRTQLDDRVFDNPIPTVAPLWIRNAIEKETRYFEISFPTGKVIEDGERLADRVIVGNQLADRTIRIRLADRPSCEDCCALKAPALNAALKAGIDVRSVVCACTIIRN